MIEILIWVVILTVPVNKVARWLKQRATRSSK